MTIAFVHPHKSFLSEVEAYNHFFSTCNWNCIIVDPSKQEDVRADVEWRIMGSYSQTKRIAPILIHEYSSASVPPFRELKDFVKSRNRQNPDFRLFLNEWVKNQFAFAEKCPFGFRDMGVSTPLEKWNPGKKEFDFIYIGNMDPGRKPERLLQTFATGPMSKYSILLLGQNFEWLQKKFSSSQNIFFKGPVKHIEVNEWLGRSSFGMNYLAPRYPFIFQTSTKFLEYANMEMPIISSDYPWIREFQNKFGGRYFFMEDGFENLSWDNIQKFNFSAPDLSEWSWEHQIRKSGVLEFLESRIPGIHFASSC
jgi:hypothetical protein